MPVIHPHRIPDSDIDRANAVNMRDIASARGFEFRGIRHVGPCPRCGGADRFSIDIRKQAFRCRGCHEKGGGGSIRLVMFLDEVEFPEAVRRLLGEHSAPVDRVAVSAGSVSYERQQREKAAWLWSQRRPLSGSIAESYLRKARGISCALPPTLAFLAATKSEHHPAMIAAFGLCDEIEPGIIAAPREIVAVHLTLLRPDGSGKAEVAAPKLMIGSPIRGNRPEAISSRPIVVAPPNDLLGLAITEGIEDALTAHQALGLGAWAAGSAGFMPKLVDVVPSWIDCVTIFAHADDGGQDGARQLAAGLRKRRIETIIEGIGV